MLTRRCLEMHSYRTKTTGCPRERGEPETQPTAFQRQVPCMRYLSVPRQWVCSVRAHTPSSSQQGTPADNLASRKKRLTPCGSPTRLPGQGVPELISDHIPHGCTQSARRILGFSSWILCRAALLAPLPAGHRASSLGSDSDAILHRLGRVG